MTIRTCLLAATLCAAALFLCTPRHAGAQGVPQGMNYQAAVRDTLGLPLGGRAITVRLAVRRGSSTGADVYVESHTTTTDDMGLFTVVIGRGTAIAGAFPAIDWRLRDYWLDVAVDIDGGTRFVELGSQQLMSVPYALFAERSAHSDTATVALRTLGGGGDAGAWRVSGNSGTDPAKDFLGTIDSTGLSFRTNNTERLRITADGRLAVNDLSGGGGRVVVAATTRNATLGSRTLAEMIDSSVIRTIGGGLLGDVVFITNLTRRLAGSLSHDSLFVTELTRDSLFITRIRRSLDTTRSIDSVLITKLTRDSAFITTIVRHLDTLLRRDTGTALDSAATAGLLSKIRAMLIRDTSFIAAIANDSAFARRIRSVGDGLYWSLSGSRGTDPARNFIGTADNASVAFRTNGIERARIDVTGNVGIGTTTPGARLEIGNGNLLIGNTSNVAGELRLQEPSGSGTNYLAIRTGPMAANLTLQLPAIQGVAGTVLTNDGAGTLSWAAPTVAFDSTLLRIDANGHVGIGIASPLHPLHVVNNSTADESAAVYGVAARTTTNQAIGLWGDADNTGAANTGTIGVLATGNGNTVAGTSNVALQINDGELTMGRTTEAGAGYTVVENANSGIAYTAEGPSGVIEVNNLGGLLGSLGIGQSLILNHAAINNRYVTPNSIIFVQVLDVNGSALGGTLNLTFSTLVDDRANGSYRLSVSAHLAGLLPLTLGATDRIRIGYMVVNPSR